MDLNRSSNVKDIVRPLRRQWHKKNETRPTILIMDDADGVRYTLEMLLRMHGYRVLTAENGIEGLYVFKKHSEEIQLVISDIEMPGMDGIQAFQEMQQLKADQKALFISGNLSEREVDVADLPGVAGALSKPFDLNAILDTVRVSMSQ